MKRHLAGAAAMLIGATGVAQAATTVSGHTALALGALFGIHSPALGAAKRARLASLLNGHDVYGAAAHTIIVVDAASADCVAGNVDINNFNCTLAFGPQTVTLRGRAAHELFATIAEAGVPPDGAAGHIHEGLHALHCSIDPAAIAQNAGGGADCSFDPGTP